MNMRVQGCVWVLVGLLTACSSEGLEEPVSSELGALGQALSGDAREGLKAAELATGVTLKYLEQGSRRGNPVVFLHGYTDSHHSFDRNLPSFPRRFHVFVPDQRGHGGSSKPACCYTQADFAADVVAFMDAVGLERASIVGHSMGSFIAQSVALAYPERVDRLVLIGSAPTIAGNPVALELQAAVDTLTDPIDPEFAREFQASTFFQPIPGAFLDTAVADSSRVPADIWQQALAGLLDEDHSGELGEIRARTLILWGDQDIFVSDADQAALDAAIPRSRLVVFAQTGHGVHVERPRAVNRAIARFLR
jgi:pimeloyl-ACP methyl ester carboxylesterase